MSRRAAAFLGAALLAVSACGDSGSPATSSTPASLQLSREGGFAGVAEQWIIEEDGTLLRPPSDVVEQLDPAGAAALFEQATAAAFFDLEPEYMPDYPCCDRFTYRLTISAGAESHTVVTMDGTEGAPQELLDLIAAVLRAVEG